ncbi:MAG: pseudouridine synthase [Vulcanimicrobiaceae bacterium]
MMRLQKYLAHAGVASRRAAEEFIVAGRVRVNGRVVRELGTCLEDGDRVEMDGRSVEVSSDRTYLVLNKPVGVMTTMHDPRGRRTVADLLPRDLPRVVPVGRLDYDTSGLLLFTDDGDLGHRLLHPRFGVEKTYRAALRGRLAEEEIQALHAGVKTPEFRAAAARVRVVAARRDSTLVDLTIHEGRNRQIRKMFETLGHPVASLVRLRFGPVALGDLPIGHTRPLSEREVRALHSAVDESVLG